MAEKETPTPTPTPEPPAKDADDPFTRDMGDAKYPPYVPDSWAPSYSQNDHHKEKNKE